MAGGGPAEGLWEEEERRVGEVVVVRRRRRSQGVRTAAPVDEKAIPSGIANATVKGNDVACIELFVLNKTAPTFSHHVALAAIPVRVTKAPGLSIRVLKVQDEALVVGGRVQREVFLGVLFGDDQTV